MLKHLAVLLLCLGSALGQSSSAVQSDRCYPSVAYAEVPLYPIVARWAHLGGIIEIEVTVENGAVVETRIERGTIEKQLGGGKTPVAIEGAQEKLLPYLSLPSVANVKTWRFGPGERCNFVVRYEYSIEGQMTTSPENPKVELDFPGFVKITAKPFEPTLTR